MMMFTICRTASASSKLVYSSMTKAMLMKSQPVLRCSVMPIVRNHQVFILAYLLKHMGMRARQGVLGTAAVHKRWAKKKGDVRRSHLSNAF